MRLNKDIMIALVDEQDYNANSRESSQVFYDDENEMLTIITNKGQEFSFEVGQDMDVRDAKEAGIYDAFITVHHDLEAHVQEGKTIGILDKYLEVHGITRYQLAKESGISQTTWFNVNYRPLDRWTVKQVWALAECTGVSTDTVWRELEDLLNLKGGEING